MRWRTFTVGLSLVLGACGGTSAVVAPVSEMQSTASPYTVSKAQPPRVYESDNGIVLTMVYLENAGGESKALAHFVGLEHALAAKVFLVVNRKSGGNDEFDLWETMFDGEYRSVMKSDHKTHEIEFYAPRSWARVEVVYDRAGSAAVDADSILAQHEQDKEELSKLALLDFEFHKQIIQKRGGAEMEKVSEACGSKLSLHMDWDSYSNAQLSGEDYCRYGLTALTRICGSSLVARQVASNRISDIECLQGESDSALLDTTGKLKIVATGKSASFKTLKKEIAGQLGIRQTVLKGESGRYLVFEPMQKGMSPVYWGDDVTMRQLRVKDGSSLVELSTPSSPVFILQRPTHWDVACPGGALRFKELEKVEADKLLDNAAFGEPIWKRREVALARDNDGVYYYVDRASLHYGGKDYRVYRGLRGQMVQTKLYDIVDDAKGKVFSTDKGNLRLILTPQEKGEAFWLQGKKREALTVIGEFEPGYMRLIYRELGVYDGEELGLLCP